MLQFKQVFKDGFVFSLIVPLSARELHLHPFKLLFPVWWTKFKVKSSDNEMGDTQGKFSLVEKVS